MEACFFCVDKLYIIIYIISMKNIHQQRRDILEQMGSIEHMQRGTLSQQHYRREQDGKTVVQGPYHVLQRTQNGKHYSERVPAEKVSDVQKAITGQERFWELADQYVDLTEAMTRQEMAQESKKNFSSSNRRSSRRPKRSCA